MTIKHIVLLPFKPSVSQQDIQIIMQSLSDLKSIIPQILSFTWGKNNSPENLHRGYTHGFIMEFENDSDRKFYLEHPAHVKVAQEMILPALVDGINSPIVLDYTPNAS